MRKQTSCQKREASWSNLHTSHPTVKQRPSSKKPASGQSGNDAQTLGQKRIVYTSWTEQLKSQSLDSKLDTVNSSSSSTHWKVPTLMNALATQVLKVKPSTTSCSPAPPSKLWDVRHGPVRWMPTGSFRDPSRHRGRLQTLPYSLDQKSSIAWKAEEEEEVYKRLNAHPCSSFFYSFLNRCS